ncbi:MAG: quinate 5-dehydrogenase [Trueperaceae bacterium]
MSHAVKHVVSVSLGSSARDVDVTVDMLGERVRIQRRGTDGSVAGARALVAELDGQVDAIGLGGLDLFLQWMGRRYYFREARLIAAAAKRTPVVCGAGLKDTLERRAVALLDESVGWRGRRVLLTLAVDRFGMAEALVGHGADVRFGDLMFALGLPWPIHSMRTLDRVARTLAPPLTKLPVSWLYPTGSKQNEPATSQRFAQHYAWAEVVAGDWHTIRRYAPERLDGLTIFTNTTTKADVAFLQAAGAARLVTTTPRFEGRSLATNLLEATFVALRGPDQGRAGYEAILDELAYAPTEVPLA